MQSSSADPGRAFGALPRIGFLAPEHLPVPPHVPGASVSRVVFELARRLAEDADVTVCSIEHPSIGEGRRDGIGYLRVPAGLDRRRHAPYEELARVLRRADLPRRELPGTPFYSRRYAQAGLGRLAEIDPDVVHLQNVSQFVPLARRRLPHACIALHMHCDWLCQLPAGVVRRRLARADLVLGVSNYITGRIADAFPELADRCRTLHNGVDAERFSPARQADGEELRRRLGLQGRPVVLYVGTIAPEKGTTVLLDAFARVREKLPDAALVIAGRPNRYFQVRTRSSRAELRAARLEQRSYPGRVEEAARAVGNVLLVGGIPHDELPAYYAAADVFAMPSTKPEPFALPVLEALASGLPIVGTRTGGIPEAVRPGLSGLLVEPGNAEELADVLLDVLGDTGMRVALGSGARALAETEFTWRRAATRLLAMYRSVLDAPAVATAPASALA